MKQLNIIAHRGLWSSQEEQCTQLAYKQAFSRGFGAETDVFLMNDTLMVTHPSMPEKSFPLEDLLQMRQIYKRKDKETVLPLILHMQSSGIAVPLKKLIQQYAPDDKNIMGFGYDYATQNFAMRQGIPMLSTITPSSRDAAFLYKPTPDNTDLVLREPHEIEPAGVYVEHSPTGFVNWDLVEYLAADFTKGTAHILKQIRARQLDKNDKVHILTNHPEKMAAFFDIQRPRFAQPLKMNASLFKGYASR